MSSKEKAAIWKSAEEALVSGDALTLERLLRDHDALFREQRPDSSWCGGLSAEYSRGDVKAIIAREHHFQNWGEFSEYQTALKEKDSPEAQFEAAVEAIINGDIDTLERLLRDNRTLVHARSKRKHHSTLLHYVGANGVEGFRQKTPHNAVKVAEILLNAGAEIDSMADMYGGSTTLGLIATSIHPVIAGVQLPLMELFLARGARIDGGFEEVNKGGYTHGAVNGCLANGRPKAAEFLAARGARLDLEGAAGVGRLDVVRSFFNEDGSLKATATEAQMKSGFNWACEYGRTDVVEFLVQKGIKLGEIHRGETGLHWAAYAGHADIVKLLLERNAPIEVRDESWHNTPLGWALHGWIHPPNEQAQRSYYDVVALLLGAGASVDPKWLSNEKVRGDERMRATLQQK